MNNFSELAGRLKKVSVEEFRKQDPGYLEFVQAVQDLPQIYPVLEEYFGPPFKPAGVAPSKEAASKTAHYGGIQTQQTLYYVERDGLSSCAMIWPWQDKARATVKVAQGEISK